MGEEIAFENGRISDFQMLVTLTLDRTHFIRSTRRSRPKNPWTCSRTDTI